MPLIDIYGKIIMNKMEKAIRELSEIDRLTEQKSPVHDLSPLAKLLVTIAYIAAVVSFGKYQLSGLLLMVLYPVFMFQLSGIPVSTCFYKLRIVLPLVIFVGLFNPFFDRVPMLRLGNITISSGVISMITLMLKGIFSLMASFLLIATTSIDSICAALRKLHVPSILVTLLLLTYRYVGLMTQEASVMTDAYMLRAPGQKGIHISAWGSFLGQLLLRSMDRAEDLYASMRLRGFTGDFTYAKDVPFRAKDAAFLIGCIAVFLILRFVNIASFIGGLFVR